MATTAELRTQLRERLGESTAAAWTDTELDRWLLEGVQEIANRTEYNRTIVEQNVSAGEFRVLLSDTLRVQRVHKAEWIPVEDAATAEAGGATHQVYRLEYQNISTMDAIRGSGQLLGDGVPAYYALWGVAGVSMTVVLYPRPSAAGTLRLHVYGSPAAPATEDTELSLPMGWEHLVLMYGEYRALVRDKDDRWQIAKTEFEEAIQSFKRMFSTYTDETEQVQPWGSGATGWQYDLEWGLW